MRVGMGPVNVFLVHFCSSLLCLAGCMSTDFSKCRQGYGHIECDDLFRKSIETRDYTLRHACASALVDLAKPDRVEQHGPAAKRCLNDYFSKGTEREKEFAALLLFLLGTEESLRQVAPYYTEKLGDPHFTMRDLSGMSAYMLQPYELTILGKTGEERIVMVAQRHALPVVVELGAHAIPHLLPLLSAKEFEIRANAYFALRDITGLRLLFREDKTELKAETEMLLQEAGAYRAGDESVQERRPERPSTGLRSSLWYASVD